MTQDEEWLLKEKYQGEKTEGFFADSARLESGEPLAYIIGHIPFLNTMIYLDLPVRQAGSRPLIPRTETEFWVEKIINKIIALRVHSATPQHTPIRVLDLCAGSGCIGVAVLKAIPESTVDFAEIDRTHHSTIGENIRRNGINESRTKILGGDLFECITDTYDYILTNPPYIDPSIDRTQESVKKHEPNIALYGGEKGMEIISHIIQSAPKFLKQNGVLVIEHEPEQCESIQAKARESELCMNTRRDQFGIKRYTYLIRKIA